jgi:FkbM family methyltransferase
MSDHYCSPLTWALLRILRRTRVLSHLNFTVRARFGSTSLPVPVNGGVGINLLVKDEPWMAALLSGLLRSFQGAFIDVGVNVGQTLCKVKALDPARSYHGFEPNPVCIHYAQELVQLHGYAHATVTPIGLSDHDGLLQLELHSANSDDSSATTVADFRPGFNVHRRFIIPVRKYASVSSELAIGPVGVVKIDVEGGEREVLLGMEDQLRTDRAAVILEILPPGRHSMRLTRQQEVEELFARAGYTLHRIAWQDGGLRLERMQGPIGVHDDQSLSNYVALPQERTDDVLKALLQR